MSRSSRPVARAARLLVAAAFVLPACTEGSRDAAPSPSVITTTVSPSAGTSLSPSPSVPATVSPTASPSSSAPGAPSCAPAHAEPDPKRPVVSLRFAVADSKETVTGMERVTFTPDLPVDRLVFRLWANSPVPRRSGGSTRVTAVTVESRPATFTPNGDGTLVTVPLGRTVAPGTALGVQLDFTLTLPNGANERLGHRGGVAWFGSGFPLLAWQRGRGWATEPATSAFAEAATSETFRLASLEVDTAPGDVVLATGTPTDRDGPRVHRGAAEAVRDVMVTVGPLRVAQAYFEGGVVRVGVSPGLPDDPQRLVTLHLSALKRLSARFGKLGQGLDVAVVPYLEGGVEFPGAILLGSGQDRDATLVHEVTHQWFYSLVGNNQARDPWLDEALTTYAEALVSGTGSRYTSSSIPAAGRNRVGAPMTFWESRKSAYYRSVYVQGAAAMLRARATVGAQRFDAAFRCYVNANAHRIATPADLRGALAPYPEAVAILRRVGALPG